MNRDEVLKKIEEARVAIQQFKTEGLERTALASEQSKVEMIKRSSEMLISEARSIGAAGQPCPRCGGTGRA
jgi:hypothetical protein